MACCSSPPLAGQGPPARSSFCSQARTLLQNDLDGTSNTVARWTAATLTQDATRPPSDLAGIASFKINETISLNLEGVNLTNELERLYTTGNGTMDPVREYNTTGRQYYGGVRVNF